MMTNKERCDAMKEMAERAVADVAAVILSERRLANAVLQPDDQKTRDEALHLLTGLRDVLNGFLPEIRTDDPES